MTDRLWLLIHRSRLGLRLDRHVFVQGFVYFGVTHCPSATTKNLPAPRAGCRGKRVYVVRVPSPLARCRPPCERSGIIRDEDGKVTSDVCNTRSPQRKSHNIKDTVSSAPKPGESPSIRHSILCWLMLPLISMWMPQKYSEYIHANDHKWPKEFSV